MYAIRVYSANLISYLRCTGNPSEKGYLPNKTGPKNRTSSLLLSACMSFIRAFLSVYKFSSVILSSGLPKNIHFVNRFPLTTNFPPGTNPWGLTWLEIAQ